MTEEQIWVIIAAINDINYCLSPSTRKKDIVFTLKKTREMLRKINQAPELEKKSK